MTIVTTGPGILEHPITSGDVFSLDENQFAPLYNVILHNDDVNAMHFVVNVLMETFGYDQTEATKLMMEAHQTGCVVVRTEPFDDAKLHAEQLKSHGLTATIEPDE
jgi:ATP-dependent Clp protease adaptor protein ClpS